ncbi:MAG: hypothetical protein STSR0008_11140 [Ignavibacterium sp.]
MKKLSLMVLALIIFFGCGEKKEETPQVKNEVLTYDSSDIQAPSLDPNSIGNVNLEYKLEKDKRYNFRLTSIAKETQTIEADTFMANNVEQTIIYKLTLDVKDIDPEKIMEIEFNFNSIRLDAIANGKKFTYQSGTKLDSLDQERYLDYESLINNPFTARISKTGDIVEVFKADRIVNKILELRKIKDSVSIEEKKSFQQEIIEGALKPLITQIFRKLPDKSLAKDSAWSFQPPALNLQIVEFDNSQNFKLIDFKKFNESKLAVINATVKSKAKISPQAKQNNIAVKNPDYYADGTIYFNLDKGLIQKSKTKTTLNLEMSMNMPTQKGMQKVTRKQSTINTNILEFL